MTMGPSTLDHFDLRAAQGDDIIAFDLQFFIVSENGLIAKNTTGIHLYHIPEFGP